MTEVRLGPPTQALRTRIIEAGWLDDLAANRARGLPDGDAGRLEARREMLKTLEMGGDGLIGIYSDLEPAGLLTVERVDSQNRTIEVWLYVDHEHRGDGTAKRALGDFLDYAFGQSEDVYRVEVRLLQVKGGLKRASEFLKGMGFTQEAIQKAAVWQDGRPYNRHVFRLLRPDWEHRKEQEAA